MKINLQHKKVLSIFLVVFMIVGLLAGCTTSTNDPSTGLKDGTYIGTGKGNNGDIKVEMKVEGGKIASVQVLEHSETPGISDPAIANIPKAIVDGQTLAVDTVSGATNASNGILAAVKDCIIQAGGNPDDFMVAKEKELSNEVVELTTDLLVIGGGAAGMSSSLRANQLGLDVILLEKTATIGGAISVSGGNQVVTLSKLQKEAGVTNDSVDSMVQDFLKNGANLNDKDLLTLYASNVGETTDWLHEYVGVEYNMEGGLHKLAEYSIDRELAYTGGGSQAAATLRKAIEKSGINLYLNTRAEKLVTDASGKVVGAVAKDNTGKTYNITAKAVLMATGGYGNNKDLLTDEMKQALYYGPASSTGDGLIMATAEDVNAATRLLEYGKRYPNGVEVSPGYAKSTINGNIAAFKESAILVNKSGKRVVNEKSSNRTILEAEIKQEGSMLYLLMDQATFDIFKSNLKEGGITEANVNDWLAGNGSTTPQFFHADTIADLAKLAGMDAATLQATVDRYNGFVKAGKDAEFGRAPEYLKKEISAGPYYLVEQKPRFATTMGGLVVNTSLQVINKDNQVIPGLYAAGEVVGGVMGDDSPSGANNGWALTSGKLAAEAIFNTLK